MDERQRTSAEACGTAGRGGDQALSGAGTGPAPVQERPCPGGDGSTLLWVEPALSAPSGGLRYNQQVREALDRRGLRSEVLSLRGAWPCPSEQEAAAALEQLRGAASGREVRAVIIDGLIGGCVPELLEIGRPRGGPGRRRRAGPAVRPGEDASPGPARGLKAAAEDHPAPAVLLVHLSLAGAAEAEYAAGPAGRGSGSAPPGALEAAHERRAVQAAEAVVATSRWSAEDLRRRYGREDAVVAVPGVRQAPGAAGAQASGGGRAALGEGAQGTGSPKGREGPGRTLRLTCVASLNPLKNQRFLAEVLEPLLAMDWTLSLVGAGADTQYGHEVLRELSRRLPGRVEHRGVLGPPELAEHWGAADLLLLPSRLETYGMVVTEACAHGVPSFVSAGTGAQEALGDAAAASGWAFPADDPGAWTRAVRQFLADPQSRAALGEGVSRRRPQLPTWDRTAAALVSGIPRSPAVF